MAIVARRKRKKVTPILQSFILLYARARPKVAAAGIRGRNFKGAAAEPARVSPLERTVSALSRSFVQNRGPAVHT